jgi:hypothetical protein
MMRKKHPGRDRRAKRREWVVLRGMIYVSAGRVDVVKG